MEILEKEPWREFLGGNIPYLNRARLNVSAFAGFIKFEEQTFAKINPAETGRELNVHKAFLRRPGGILNALCPFNICPVSTGKKCELICNTSLNCIINHLVMPFIMKFNPLDTLKFPVKK